MNAPASWFHCSVKTVSRSAGRSVVAAAAYRLGERLEDREYGGVHDYRRRSGVETCFTIAPDLAPGWASNPERLWNAAEQAETRRNSRVGRECELALPSSLDADTRERITEQFAKALVARYGVAVSVGIHTPSRHGDDRNHHAHLLMTTRAIDADGFGEKTRVLDDKKSGPQEVLWMRQKAASLINEALEDAGLDERVTHLSFEARGIDRVPTEHLGPSASEMERRHPGSSDRGERNRDIEATNQTLDALVVELATLHAEIAEAEEQELNARYGMPEPEPEARGAPDTRILPSEPEAPPPRDAMRASFDDAIRRDLAAVDGRQAEAWTVPRSFDAAIRPAIRAVEQTGETWFGAKLWQKAAEFYERGMSMIADLGREALGYWQSFIRDHEPDRDSDGPER